MGKFFRLALPTGLCLWLMIETFSLKTISFDKIPQTGVTFDEYAFAWMGKSFRQSGLPMSWSTNLETYKESAKANGTGFAGFNIEINGTKPTWNNIFWLPKPAYMITEIDYGIGKRQIGVVQPYFDHPPLAGIIYSLGITENVTSLSEVKAQDFRLINRYLGLLTAGLIYLLGSRLFSTWAGLIAAGIYSTTPSTLLSARLTLAENVLIPVMLMGALLIQQALQSKRQGWWAAAGIAAGIAILIKMSGVSLLVTGGYLAWRQKLVIKRWWQLPVFGCGIYAIYLIYGHFLGGEVFWKILLNQSARAGWGIINFYQGLERLFFKGFPLDGWWIGGSIATVYLASQKLRNFELISTLTFVYMLTAVLLGGDNNSWYLFPLGALGCLAFGALIWKIASEPNLINSSIFFLFGVAASAYWGFFSLRPELPQSWISRGMAGGVIGIALIYQRFADEKTWMKLLWIGLLAALIHRMYLWNIRGMQFILLNWDKLPFPLMWNQANG